MMSNTNSQAQPGKVKRTSFSGFSGSSASFLLDRSKAGIRGSTPDSEALASSDDEQDHHHRLHAVTGNPGSKSARRPSWLIDTQQASMRKISLTGNGPFSPASPSSVAPSSDQVPWGSNVTSNSSSTVSRGHVNNTSFPWGNTIWNNEPQKGLPQRLTEVLPSPTTVIPQGSGGVYSEEPLRSPPLVQENLAESAIPFAIPLQPTLKTYRSQSYSVGQLDPESSSLSAQNFPGYGTYGRSARPGAPYPGLQHRPSRPSILGDLSHDTSLLGQLREVEDDESSTGSDLAVQLSTTQARTTIEQLAMENAMLRQAAADHMEKESKVGRGRLASSGINKALRGPGQNYQQRKPDSVIEENENVLYEVDDSDTNQLQTFEGIGGRRSSEYVTKSNMQYTVAGILENRTLESVKKGHWQSSLGFAGIGEPPQSRRHSFADVPTRQNSISSAGDTQNTPNSTLEIDTLPKDRYSSPETYIEGLARPSQGDGSEYAHFRSSQVLHERELELEHLCHRDFAVSYFSRPDTSSRNAECRTTSLSPQLQQSHSQAQYGRPQYHGHAQLRPNQLVHIVTFKAQRADVFYAQESTGLRVRKGDLVIVEADRGIDLGTVASENVPISEAKHLKEKFMQEHYNWLMVFSRHGQSGAVAGPNPNSHTSMPSDATGGMDGSSTQVGLQDPPSSEIKPKMIKRLAQSHEIQTLRDKEGNEAKAKRVCQQKVVEHRLNMEVLEAEFQVDWKKLTFYYFADEYINFNSLVTDLFKIYKTRIWMSAINPASFQTPIGGLQIPGNAGPGALSGDMHQHSSRRQHRQHATLLPSASAPMAATTFENPWSPGRDASTIGGVALAQSYAQPFPPQDLDIRQVDQYPLEYRQDVQQMVNVHSHFTSPRYHAPNVHSFDSRPENSNGLSQASRALGREWNESLYGLTLGP